MACEKGVEAGLGAFQGLDVLLLRRREGDGDDRFGANNLIVDGPQRNGTHFGPEGLSKLPIPDRELQVRLGVVAMTGLLLWILRRRS